MTSPVLTIPDDIAALPGWLDHQLLGPDLDLLAAELAVVNRPTSTVPVLADVLGDNAAEVLAGGLGSLPRSALVLLLRHPTLLAELRELVLTEGGPYWDTLVDDDLTAAGHRVAARIRQAIGADPPAIPSGHGLPRWCGYAATIFATAAAVLVVVYLAGGLRQPGPQPAEVATAAWGFTKVQDLPRDAGDTATLTALADLASEWQKKRPETALDLARRLIEFRGGCAAIQIVPLPLSESQARWVRLRCGDWAAEIDSHIRALEDGREVAVVRAAADRTAERIETELRARANLVPRA